MRKLVIKLKLILLFTTLINIWIQILFLPQIIYVQYRLLPLQDETAHAKQQKALAAFTVGQALTQNTVTLYALTLSTLEYQHLVSVSQLLFRHQIYCVLSSLVTVCLYCATNEMLLTRKLIRQFLISITLILVTTVLVLLRWWETFFTYFHLILFPEGNWSFPAQSMLIQLFPDRFWQIMSAEVLVLAFLSMILVSPLLIHGRISK